MARRNDHSKDELQRLILNTVKDFLNHYPTQELSLRKVARLIGYSPATVINSFGSYNDLLLAANAETLDELHILSTVAVREENHPQLGLKKLARIQLGFARKYPHRWQLAFEHRIPVNKELPEWHQMRINRLFALFTEQLSRIETRRNLQDIHVASRVIWAGVHGICLLSAGSGVISEKHTSGEQMLDSLLDNYLASWVSAGHLSTVAART